MKRLSGIILAVAFTTFFAMQGFTQNDAATQKQTDLSKTGQQKSAQGGNFVDKNKNGVCDNFEARGNSGHGRNFVDKNGDGKCDNCQSDCKGKGNGKCCGKGVGNCQNHSGKGQGCCGKGYGYQHRHGCSDMKQEPAKSSPDNGETK